MVTGIAAITPAGLFAGAAVGDVLTGPCTGDAIAFDFAALLDQDRARRLDRASRLAALAKDYPTAVPQRTGWLLERVAEEIGAGVDLAPLEEVARARLKPTPLAASGRQAGPFNERWNILVNADVESDL